MFLLRVLTDGRQQKARELDMITRDLDKITRDLDMITRDLDMIIV